VNAPTIWIIIPLGLAFILFLLPSRDWVKYVAFSIMVLFATMAIALPVETTFQMGETMIKITPSLTILGRRFNIDSGDQILLALLYFSTALWLLAPKLAQTSQRFYSIAIGVTVILLASLSVEPFLYAALFIETGVLLIIPLLVKRGQSWSGAIRFLIFMSLAMPLILFSGWLLSGIEANPGDITLVRQVVILLAIGFAFLLAIFPLHSWIPKLTESSSLWVVGFVLWIFPTAIQLFGIGFIDRYSWLRDSPSLQQTLLTTGIMMILFGGVMAGFQRHLGRIFGFAVMVETGFSLLSIGLGSSTGIELFISMLLPRVISLCIWAYALEILSCSSVSLRFRDIKGLARQHPFAASGLVLSHLSMAGLPLLVGFPLRQYLLEATAAISSSYSLLIMIGLVGLFISVLRSLASLVMAPEKIIWTAQENIPQRIFLSIGSLSLIILGIFPQWAKPLLAQVPFLFDHIGR